MSYDIFYNDVKKIKTDYFISYKVEVLGSHNLVIDNCLHRRRHQYFTLIHYNNNNNNVLIGLYNRVSGKPTGFLHNMPLADELSTLHENRKYKIYYTFIITI